MRQLKRAFVFQTAIALGVLAAPAAWAAGFLYECDMDNVGQGRGWVSPKIAIVQPVDGSTLIIDALTLSFAEDPVVGTVLRNDSQRLIVKWSLRDIRADNGRSFAHFDYRASIAKRSGKIELTAGPRSSDTGLRSTGQCSKRTE